MKDPLATNVDPRTGSHLPVHHQTGGVEFAEVLPVGPVGDKVGVGDQHARRGGVGFKDGDRLARLHEQRLIGLKIDQLTNDRVVTLLVARRLADSAVDDQLLWLLRHIGVQVVLQHPQDRLLLPALAAKC